MHLSLPIYLLLLTIFLAVNLHLLLLGTHNSLIEVSSANFFPEILWGAFKKIKERVKKQNIPGPNPGPCISEGLGWGQLSPL